ncbi:MAG: hypothetical protein WAN22_11875 [Solirubrobacteraceae bacterium]
MTALTAALLVPLSYTVDELSLTVTFSPVGVDNVKLEDDTPLTVPSDPPTAFVDLALDPPPEPPPLAKPPGPLVLAAAVAVVVAACELDEPPHAATPTPRPSTGTINPTVAPRRRPVHKRHLRPAWPESRQADALDS